MNEYIATFYSHFGAIRFKRSCEAAALEARIMPVPRNLSSSCGTCVKFQARGEEEFPEKNEEMEQLVQVEGDDYLPIYAADE